MSIFLTSQDVEFEKRAWNSHFNGGLGKRAWNSHFNGGLGIGKVHRWKLANLLEKYIFSPEQEKLYKKLTLHTFPLESTVRIFIDR